MGRTCPLSGREAMRIVDLRIHSIAIADPPLRSSYGLHAPYALRTVIELVSDDNIVGIGETLGGDAIAQALAALKPKLIGLDPFQLAGALMPLIEAEAPSTALERSQTMFVPGENPLDQ